MLEETAVKDIYRSLLKRMPSDAEVSMWKRLEQGDPAVELIKKIADSPEYKKIRGVHSIFPAGHYYSPIVDPCTVRDYVDEQRKLEAGDLDGIALDRDGMIAFWEQSRSVIRSMSFGEAPSDGQRFHFNNGAYPYGDAITLRAMIASLRPKHIIEIGSGFTTACILDTADEIGLSDLQLRCIEPYPQRLKSILRPDDLSRIELVESGVQSVPPSTFDHLGRGDILLIDSTHVLKTGSDVHYEIFSILPRLPAGVMVHVHDVPFPFEYPDDWIFVHNHSWNEAYFLRAFLMYNLRFQVFFWNSLFARLEPARIKRDAPSFLVNPGSSIWLEVK